MRTWLAYPSCSYSLGTIRFTRVLIRRQALQSAAADRPRGIDALNQGYGELGREEVRRKDFQGSLVILHHEHHLGRGLDATKFDEHSS